MAVAKKGKKTFSSNGKAKATTVKVRTAVHSDIKSLRESSKQQPMVRLTFKEGEARTVRFLSNPDTKTGPGAWVEFYEHFVPSPGGGSYVPCIEECKLDGDIRASKRWYVNVWDRDSKSVRLLKLTGSMVENLIVKFERRGTLLDRDYSITRTGSSTDTQYHIEAEDREKFDQKNPKLIDIYGYLDQAAQSYYGGGKPVAARATTIDDDEEEDEDEIEAAEDDEEEEDEEDDDEEDDEEDEEGEDEDEDEEEDDDEDVDEDEEEEEDEEDEDEEEEAPKARRKAPAARSTTKAKPAAASAGKKRPLGKARRR